MALTIIPYMYMYMYKVSMTLTRDTCSVAKTKVACAACGVYGM